MSFPQVSPKQSFPALESEVLAYWKANNTFQKSIDSRPEDNPYRFYDGPPFITGTPHYGSLLSSIVKDVVGRYWTMRGKRVDRVWGWDCHGLPIEEKVQKKLGLKSNREIEERGVKEFIDGCYEYTQSTSAEWDWYIDKIGRWVDMDRAYRTMDQEYMESVMWVFSQLWNKGLIYEGKRVSLYSWKLSTPISNFEVAMDDTYQEVNDPAITVKFRIPERDAAIAWVLDENERFLLGWSNKYNGWHLVGGAVDKGETIEECLLRELEEEVGVKRNKNQITLIGQDSQIDQGSFWRATHFEVHIDSNEIKNGEPEKFREWKWFTKQELIEVYDELYEVDKYPIDVFLGKKTLHRKSPSLFALAWTTTPWTIPANMALAVRNDIDYILVSLSSPKIGEAGRGVQDDTPPLTPPNLGGESEQYIVAKNRAESVFKGKGEYSVICELKGSELVGLGYVPPFPEYYYQKHGDKNHKIYHADFITDTDGTGIGHEAPEFGDVDFQLAKREGIFISEAMDEAGKYTSQIFDYEGTHYLNLEEPEKGANRINIERMKANNTLFKLENITHRVPFCPRSGTPLMQKAQSSWFIDIASQKDKLLEANKQINWFPEHLKFGRFAKGIESAPDWCISRTRFWGAPMPVWMGEDGEKVVVSSRDEIFEMNKPYGQVMKVIFVRHGESIKNTERIIDGTDKPRFPLTEKGREEAKETAEKLSSQKISAIYSSPFARAQETAEIINERFSVEIKLDDRLREVFLGDMDGKKRVEIEEYYVAEHDKYISDWNHKIGGGDSANEILERMKSFVFEIGEKHKGETVVVVSHADQIAIIKEYLTDKKAFANNIALPKVGEPLEIIYDVANKKQLNLHRPYIDAVKLQSPKTGQELTRIPEVLDVWMDSGSMPYAQMHYPFENKGEMEASFPADFIAEYVGQVRAWFYVMHVLGVLLNPNNEPTPTPSFTNVITTGVINGNDGRKMSKSYGNYPDPRLTIEKYGADPIRFYMLNSPLLSGGDMDFKEEQIIETVKGVMLPIWNTYSFFTTYANIDQWQHDETEVWFTRHGQSESNLISKMSDHTDDPSLTENGRKQAENAAKNLIEQGMNFDIIIHTSKIRAIDTAHIIGDTLGFSGEYIIDDRFAEQSAGEYAGKTLGEIARMANIANTENHPALRKIYKNNSEENIEQFETRILSAYEDVLQKYKGKRVFIVAHAGTSRPILNHYFGKGLEPAHYETKIGNAEPLRLMTTPLVNPLDRWVLSRLQVLMGQVHDAMDGYDVSRACRAIVSYMDELTNWYVRLSRRRFWGSEMTPDKASAYETLYTVLTETAKLLAPYMPFISEDIFRGLTNRESVHLEYITRPNHHLVDSELNRDMEVCEHIVSLGLALRSRVGVRVRQPLQSITITQSLSEYYQAIIRDELNVKEVRFENPEKLAKKICKPDARKIGPKYGKDVQKVIVEAKNGNFVEKENGIIDVGGFVLEIGEYMMEYTPLEGVGDVEGGYGMVISLDTSITESLRLEGYARDIIRLIQDMRKEADYQVMDRVSLHIYGDMHTDILAGYADMIQSETLSTLAPLMVNPDVEKDIEIEPGVTLTVQIEK